MARHDVCYRSEWAANQSNVRDLRYWARRRRHSRHFSSFFMSEMGISLDSVVRFRWTKRLYPLFRTQRFQWYPDLWATLLLNVLNQAPKSALQKKRRIWKQHMVTCQWNFSQPVKPSNCQSISFTPTTIIGWEPFIFSRQSGWQERIYKGTRGGAANLSIRGPKWSAFFGEG